MVGFPHVWEMRGEMKLWGRRGEGTGGGGSFAPNSAMALCCPS